MMYLLDSNIVIYSARSEPAYADLRNWIKHPDAALSALSRLEIMGFHSLTSADARYFQTAFTALPQLPITDAILSQAITLRQQYRLKTPDAIIAATALTHGLQLLTVDSGFTRIVNLMVLNPLVV